MAVSLEVIASIDLLKGQVVRLERGDYKAATVFGTDPVAIAQDWEGQGAPRLHIVDLDGARSGEASNEKSVSGIIQRVAVPIQVAGGIRSIEAGERWLATGADRVVFGTKALTDEAFLAEAVEAFGPQLVIAADCRAGEIHVAGWEEGTGEDVVDCAERLAGAGVPRLLVTDISVDGMLEGPNVDLYAELADVARIPVIASGGVSSIDDLIALSRIRGVEGAIVGKALYVGAVDLGDAIKAVA
jgi:phosphoribosylformimino-5-aminoimidazole carboxamide ribotide isomerase